MAWESYNNLREITLLWELGFLKRANTYILVITTISSFILYVNSTKFLNKLLILSYSLLSFALLISTLARIFWLSALFGSLLLVFFFNYKQRIRYITTTLMAVIIVVSGVITFSSGTSDLVISYFKNRFSSLDKGKQDISLVSRIDEYNTSFKHIKRYPIGGSGMVTRFPSYNVITGSTSYINFIHNSFILFSYFFGIPLMLCYFYFYLYYLNKSFWKIFTGDNFQKSIAIITFISILTFFIVSTLTSIHTERDFLYAFPFVLGIFSITNNIKDPKNAC